MAYALLGSGDTTVCGCGCEGTYCTCLGTLTDTCAHFGTQVFLVSDAIYAFLVYNYDLLHGLPRVDKDGKPMKLKLA